MTIFNPLRSLLLASLCLLTLSSCAREAAQDRASVSVTAVNYTDRELNGYLFLSPDGEKKQVAGGPPARPFEEAGTMCCYSLPAKWRKGIRVRVQYDWWQGDDQPRKYIVKEVEVPPYPDGQVGTLWALLYSDDSVEVVSSDFAPGHAKWPGKEKGWPKPSLEYKQKVWQEEYLEEVARFNRLSKTVSEMSDATYEEYFESYKSSWPDFIGTAQSSKDRLFIEKLNKFLQEHLESSADQIKKMEAGKP